MRHTLLRNTTTFFYLLMLNPKVIPQKSISNLFQWMVQNWKTGAGQILSLWISETSKWLWLLPNDALSILSERLYVAKWMVVLKIGTLSCTIYIDIKESIANILSTNLFISKRMNMLLVTWLELHSDDSQIGSRGQKLTSLHTVFIPIFKAAP